MKVYFDIITNHTADVIGYGEGRPAQAVHVQGPVAVPHGVGTPFDDRDYADGSPFPALAPTGQPSCVPPPPRSAASRTTRACRTPSATSRSRRG